MAIMALSTGLTIGLCQTGYAPGSVAATLWRSPRVLPLPPGEGRGERGMENRLARNATFVEARTPKGVPLIDECNSCPVRPFPAHHPGYPYSSGKPSAST